MYRAIRISMTRVKVDLESLELHQILESIGPNMLFQTKIIQKLLQYKHQKLKKYGIAIVLLYLCYLTCIILWPRWFIILPFLAQ
jgi:hypothetical protein